MVGDTGNLAMLNKIAPALKRAKRSNGEGILLRFNSCNLNEEAMLRLVSAVEKSTCIRELDCRWNPGNNERTKEAMKQAILATKSPIANWNGAELPLDIKQARLDREAREKEQDEFLAALLIRVPTREEVHLAQRELESIKPDMSSTEEELKAVLKKLARAKAKKEKLREQMRGLEEQMRRVEKEMDTSETRNDELNAKMEALQQKLVPHNAVIKRIQEVKALVSKIDVPSAAAAASPPPPSTPTQDANLCPICCENAINASLLCGHRFCRTCADAVFESRKKECPNCRKRIKGVIPSF